MIKNVFIMSVFVVVCFCASAGTGLADEKDEAGSGSQETAELQPYRIGFGDILSIVTWKEPDFSREDVTVRVDGKITFPLLNDIQASGRTAMELKAVIEEKLKDYVTSPVVTVAIRSPGSQKFYILGEVAKTGEYPLVKNLTILQAFALAGGFTEWASKKEILLFRQADGEKKIIRVNYKSILKGRDLNKDILIRANDTIVVP